MNNFCIRMIVLLLCELHIPHSEWSVNMRPNARLMRLIYHLCSSLYEHRIFIHPPKLPPLHFLSPLSRSRGAGTRVSYLVYNLTLDVLEHYSADVYISIVCYLARNIYY